MSYSKKQAAKSLGISKKELEKRAKSGGFDSTESYWNSIGGAAAPITEALKKELIAIDRQLFEMTPYLSLSDEEIQQFLDKAIEEVEPYYTRKKSELESQLKEGKVRTAEDTLDLMRDIERETSEALQRFDLSTAATEEEFTDRLASLTARTEDEVAMKKDDWRQRIETSRLGQIQRGMFTSGIAGKERRELQERKELELDSVGRRAEEQETELGREKKFDLQQIQLAREAAQNRRIEAIGTPEEKTKTEQEALGTLGYESAGQLGSDAEIAQQRTKRGITPSYNKYAMTDLEEKRRLGVESRKLELQEGELARRNQEYDMQRKNIMSERARKAKELQTYGIHF